MKLCSSFNILPHFRKLQSCTCCSICDTDWSQSFTSPSILIPRTMFCESRLVKNATSPSFSLPPKKSHLPCRNETYQEKDGFFKYNTHFPLLYIYFNEEYHHWFWVSAQVATENETK